MSSNRGKTTPHISTPDALASTVPESTTPDGLESKSNKIIDERPIWRKMIDVPVKYINSKNSFENSLIGMLQESKEFSDEELRKLHDEGVSDIETYKKIRIILYEEGYKMLGYHGGKEANLMSYPAGYVRNFFDDLNSSRVPLITLRKKIETQIDIPEQDREDLKLINQVIKDEGGIAIYFDKNELEKCQVYYKHKDKDEVISSEIDLKPYKDLIRGNYYGNKPNDKFKNSNYILYHGRLGNIFELEEETKINAEIYYRTTQNFYILLHDLIEKNNGFSYVASWSGLYVGLDAKKAAGYYDDLLKNETDKIEAENNPAILFVFVDRIYFDEKIKILPETDEENSNKILIQNDLSSIQALKFMRKYNDDLVLIGLEDTCNLKESEVNKYETIIRGNEVLQHVSFLRVSRNIARKIVSDFVPQMKRIPVPLSSKEKELYEEVILKRVDVVEKNVNQFLRENLKVKDPEKKDTEMKDYENFDTVVSEVKKNIANIFANESSILDIEKEKREEEKEKIEEERIRRIEKRIKREEKRKKIIKERKNRVKKSSSESSSSRFGIFSGGSQENQTSEDSHLLSENPILDISHLLMNNPSKKTESNLKKSFKSMQKLLAEFKKEEDSSFFKDHNPPLDPRLKIVNQMTVLEWIYSKSSSDAHRGFKSVKELKTFIDNDYSKNVSELTISKFISRFATLTAGIAYCCLDNLEVKVQENSNIKTQTKNIKERKANDPYIKPATDMQKKFIMKLKNIPIIKHIDSVYSERANMLKDHLARAYGEKITKSFDHTFNRVQDEEPLELSDSDADSDSENKNYKQKKFSGKPGRVYASSKNDGWFQVAKNNNIPIRNHVSSGLPLELALFEVLINWEVSVENEPYTEFSEVTKKWPDGKEEEYADKIRDFVVNVYLPHYQRSDYHSWIETWAAVEYYIAMRSGKELIMHDPIKLFKMAKTYVIEFANEGIKKQVDELIKLFEDIQNEEMRKKNLSTNRSSAVKPGSVV